MTDSLSPSQQELLEAIRAGGVLELVFPTSIKKSAYYTLNGSKIRDAAPKALISLGLIRRDPGKTVFYIPE
ncbi:hypothetical protein SAMN00790413_00327 [Deinococcus hopiensis KR-140]|uniref:Uncharacterized protein n=1 Tax=Deinococcus hopiensis KR-140 TaxID=695939 RepID=A0A1W1V7I8_9DEIO|nr:hypothetical protein SAMN00790413_00327 [Deinococcus hopiensis KR-140]